MNYVIIFYSKLFGVIELVFNDMFVGILCYVLFWVFWDEMVLLLDIEDVFVWVIVWCQVVELLCKFFVSWLKINNLVVSVFGLVNCLILLVCLEQGLVVVDQFY